MSFDLNRFQEARLKRREEKVPVPELKEFFDDLEEGQVPIFIVGNLYGEEIAEAQLAVQVNKNLKTIIESIAAELDNEKVEAIKILLGLPSDLVRDDYVYRIAIFKMGLIDPRFDQEQSVKFAKNFGTQFYHLTDRILSLTGMGSTLGE